MEREHILQHLQETEEFLGRSIACLDESDSGTCPVEGMMTAAQQVAHIASTIDWFRDGVFSADGFDMDFEKHSAAILDVTSLADAKAWADRAFGAVRKVLTESSVEELSAPIVDGLVMGGEPRYNIVISILDHTAHHRGALTVYSRLAGKTPAMPYM